MRWGLAHGTKVVFAPFGTPPPSAGSSFSPLDSNFNERRRVEFEAALAAYVLMDWSSVRPAIDEVNNGLTAYLQLMREREEKKYETLGQMMLPCLYNEYFGRIGVGSDAPTDATTANILKEVNRTLMCGTLQQVMNIHGIFCFCVVPHLGYSDEAQQCLWNRLTNQLTQGGVLFSGTRGRKYRRPDKSQGAPSSTVGYTAPTDRIVASFVEPHPRAVELYERENEPGPLPFVASASGSTAELLGIAKFFCPRMEGELLKQYALACVAFLTGGGHHSFHEVMQVASLAGLPHHDCYDLALPKLFKDTAWYDLLVEDYTDVLFRGRRS
jgi:hypothetical protein